MRARGSEALEFAVSPTFESQPVAVEYDRQGHRQIWRWLFLGALVVSAGLFDAWQKMKPVAGGYGLREIRESRINEERTTRVLLLELQMLRSPAYAEVYARRLGLTAPKTGDAFVLELIESPEPPPSSVLASR